MEKVADVLDQNSPRFNTISPNHIMTDALYQMCCENVDYLIVLNEERFEGVLTEHEIAKKVIFAGKPLDEITVKEFMNRNLPVATPTDSLEYCMKLLEQFNVRYLAIYDQFTFKGVVSENDLMRQALSKRKAAFEDAPNDNAYNWSY